MALMECLLLFRQHGGAPSVKHLLTVLLDKIGICKFVKAFNEIMYAVVEGKITLRIRYVTLRKELGMMAHTAKHPLSI
jgi:hypothetical protein